MFLVIIFQLVQHCGIGAVHKEEANGHVPTGG
jgi:hypothetical protein